MYWWAMHENDIHQPLSRGTLSEGREVGRQIDSWRGGGFNSICSILLLFKNISGTSLVEQRLRIHLPMQGTRVQPLVQEDPTCRGATKPVHHNYWAHVLQLLKPVRLEPVLRNKRSHRKEKPTQCDEDPMQPKLNN